MKKHLLFAVIGAVLLGATSCGKPRGHLVGVYSKSHNETAPYGMVFVPRGSFSMGANEQSFSWALQPSQRHISIDAFWMDQTEITNGEYRQFVEWVRDSIVRTKLLQEMDVVGEEEASKWFKERANYTLEGPVMDSVLNWKTKIPWKAKYDENDDEKAGKWNAVQQMYFYGQDMIEAGQLNAHLLIYKYKFVNYDQAALPGNEFNPYINAYNPTAKVRVDSAWMNADGSIGDTVIVKPLRHRSDLISTKIINIYPDTMVWMRDFSYSYNEPMMQNYFAHPGFGEFPVVGVSWDQAQAFCWWRTTNLYRAANLPKTQEWRLPTDAEWEYAARGGRHDAIYPWGGPYIRDSKGCFLANFKPMRGNYTEDGYLYPSRVAVYKPNDFGLYDMAGNVAEWTVTTYDDQLSSFTLDMNPHYNYKAKKDDPAVMRRKVVRGGSWKDVAAYLQCATVTYEYQNKRSAAIGFRCVRSYIGDKARSRAKK